MAFHRLLVPLALALLPLGYAQADAPLSPPACRYDDVPAYSTDYDAWQMTLLDPIYKLGESYAPPDLVSTSQAGFSGDYQVRGIMIDDLSALVAAAEAAGSPLELQSAYRSYAYQKRTFDYWVSEDGLDAALLSSARAGHSEHQLGTVLDFRSAGGVAPWELDDWGATPAGAWLAANAWRYGFVMSYPKDKKSVTCYIYEPWHYRYLGREVAAEVRESGLTLREWLWQRQ